MSITPSAEETEDEYLEDFIQLNYEENIYHAHRKPSDFKDLNGYWRLSEDLLLNPILRGLCKSPEIVSRTIPQVDRLLRVKLIDCGKFPWYFKRYTHQIINKLKFLQVICLSDSDTEDDCIILGDSGKQVLIKTKSDCSVMAKKSPNLQLVNNPLMTKRIGNIQRIQDIELEEALNQKNKNNIDLRRNKGLVGLTVIRKVTANDVAPDAKYHESNDRSQRTERVSSYAGYLNAADSILNSCGTDLITVIEDLTTTQQKHTHEIASNEISVNVVVRTAIDLPSTPLDVSVECNNEKKSHDDISKKKLVSPVEKTVRKVDKLQKLIPGSAIEEDSRLKLNTVEKFIKHVKDSKITNKYMNDQLKKRKIDTIDQAIEAKQTNVTVDQVKVKPISQKHVSKDTTGIKKDYKKSKSNDKLCTGFQDSIQYPILQSNSLHQKQNDAHESTSKHTNLNKTKNTSKKTSSKSSSNNLSRNQTTPNILRNSQHDKIKKISDVKDSNSNDDSVNKTGQKEITASSDQTKTLNNIHYYSLSYPEKNNITIVGTNKICGDRTKTNAFNIQGLREHRNNSMEKCPIQILSVERINSNESLSKIQIPSSGDKINRLPQPNPTIYDASKYPAGNINISLQNDTNPKKHNLPLPNRHLKHPKYCLFNNNKILQVANHKPYVICPRFGQPIQTHVSSRSMFPPNRGALSNRVITPQRFLNTSLMYRNQMPPKELQVSSSAYYHTIFHGPAQPVIPSVTIQSSQDMHPQPMNTNTNAPNYYISKHSMPGVYRTHSLPQQIYPQPVPTPQSSHYSVLQTPSQQNPSQSKRCLVPCSNNLKNNEVTTLVPSETSKGGQVTKEGMTTSPPNTSKVPASIVLETLETVDTKIKMLEELDKVIIEEDFDLYLNTTEKEKVVTTPKHDPQPKNFKTVYQLSTTKKGMESQQATNKQSDVQQVTANKINEKHATTKKTTENYQASPYKTNEMSPTLTVKGYSPPILPIPGTLEEILEKVKSEPQDNITKYSKCVKPHTSAEKAKKISLDEYKKRTTSTDATDCSPNKKMRRESIKHRHRSRAIDQRNFSVDSDLGYDSDSTVIL